jgi:hypothetical protein
MLPNAAESFAKFHYLEVRIGKQAKDTFKESLEDGYRVAFAGQRVIAQKYVTKFCCHSKTGAQLWLFICCQEARML